jgi:hypothetical protein
MITSARSLAGMVRLAGLTWRLGKLNRFGRLTDFTGEWPGGTSAEAYDDASSEAIIPMTSRLKEFARGVSVCHSDD